MKLQANPSAGLMDPFKADLLIPAGSDALPTSGLGCFRWPCLSSVGMAAMSECAFVMRGRSVSPCVQLTIGSWDDSPCVNMFRHHPFQLRLQLLHDTELVG